MKKYSNAVYLQFWHVNSKQISYSLKKTFKEDIVNCEKSGSIFQLFYF